MAVTADGWTRCGRGHQHWGRVGAAGLLLIHTDDEGIARYLLQHRSRMVQKGLTWGIPGGALAYGETALEGARREAAEEMRSVPDGLEHRFTFTDDHDGWAYHTVAMSSPEMPDTSGGWETGNDGYRWVTAVEIEQELKLHPGFAATWPDLLKLM